MNPVEPAMTADLSRARAEFLATGQDDLLPIVDAHHHYWNVAGNPHPWLTELPRIAFRYGDYAAICTDYLPADYAAACGSHRVLRHVLMEGEWTPQDPTGEALWMQRLAQAHPVPHERPHAMAAQAWLDRPDLADVLRAYAQPPLAGFVRSVRHKPRCADRAQHRSDWAEPGSMRCPRWRAGYAQLEGAGLMFELQAPWWHMAEAAELARDFPGTALIVNHAGMPGVRDEATLAAWRAALRPLADCPNVWMKISGLGVAGQPWTPGQQQPVLQALLSDFGPERCMLASNHPVDGLVVTLSQLWSGFKHLTRSLPPEKRLALFCDNAVKLYGLH